MAALAHPISNLILPQTVLPQEESDPRVSDTADTAEYLERLHKYVFDSILSLRQSQVIALDSDFASLEEQLDKLTTISEGWDGYDAPKPSLQAIDEAREVLRRMQDALVKPYWISAAADGGVAFTFVASNDRRAQIEILNTGEKFTHLYDLKGNSHTEDWVGNIEDQSFSKLLDPILHYINL